MNKILLSSLLAGTALSLSAQSYDGFQTGTTPASGEYVAGSDIDGTTGGGSGWGGDWTTAGTDLFNGTATGLTYSDGSGNTLVTTAGAVSKTGAGDSAIRSITDPANGGDFWFSVILDGSSLITNFEARFQFAFFSSTGDLKYAIQSQDDSRGWYATYNPTGAGPVTTQIDAGTLDLDDGATFFVGRVTNFNSGSADSVMRIWYNPNDLNSLGTATITTAAFQSQAFQQIRLVTDGNRSGIFDEIRVGSSIDDVIVVPEPSAYALISGCLALGWIMLRRRK